MPGLGNYILVSTDSRRPARRCSRWWCSPSFAVAFLSLVSDIIYAYLDPRVRYR